MIENDTKDELLKGCLSFNTIGVPMSKPSEKIFYKIFLSIRGIKHQATSNIKAYQKLCSFLGTQSLIWKSNPRRDKAE